MAKRNKGAAALLLLAGGAALLIGGKAKADDLPDVGPPDPNNPPPPPPDNPLDDLPTDGPKLPPPPAVCNYSGCGAAFDGKHAAPVYYALRIQQLGYPINVSAVGVNSSAIAVQPQRGYVEHFQRHFNNVAANTGGFPPLIAAKLAPLKSVGYTKPDGLIGEKTILRIQLAHNAVIATGITWENLVKIGGGPD